MSSHDFTPFKKAIQEQFATMQAHTIFEVAIDKDKLWDIYLESYPEGTNEVFRERREYDCRCCRQFIRNIGGAVVIVNNKLVSLWDVEVPFPFDVVVKKMSEYVKSCSVENQYFHYEKFVGTDKSKDAHAPSITWQHFYLKLPQQVIKDKDRIASLQGTVRTTKEVFKRGLEELTLEAAETVLELIYQNSLYRGDQQKPMLVSFIKTKKEYDKLPVEQKDNYCWKKAQDVGEAFARIRNTSLGTMLINLSEGMDLEDAVKAYEKIMAPENYKRTTSIITPKMIKQANETVIGLGLEPALHRRFAVLEDVTVNNTLFADRNVKPMMSGNAFDALIEETGKKAKVNSLSKIEEINIKDFIDNVLPKIDSMEMLFESKHANNLVSLIAPVYELDSKHNLFKWDNNFSWSYNGEVTDSLKERVKAQGGQVDGDVRISLAWYNTDDLDLHVVEPDRTHICFDTNVSRKTGGNLDVDMNISSYAASTSPVENIAYPSFSRMTEGVYRVYVNQFNQRNKKDYGFELEFEFDGKTFTFTYDKEVKGNVDVIEFKYSKKSGIEIIKSLPHTQQTKTVWGIDTNSFHRVNIALLSPNYWDDNKVGTQHYFFMLDKCKADVPARGFYNEFLNQELDKHRKVFEVLASKMKAEPTDNQLSGLGFNSTQRNSVVVKVAGKFQRQLKINF